MTYARFTMAYWCVFVVALMPIFCTALAKYGMWNKPRKDGGFDNADPRGWLARQTDWRARANAAQSNCFEALPFFVGAVIIAHQLSAVQIRLDILAFVFVVLRVMYVAMYVAGLARIRSVLWSLAFLVNIAIFFLGYR